MEAVDFFQDPNEDYAESLHRLIEGSSPCLLGFTTHSSLHAVCVIGHTLNSDLWRPEAEYAYLHSMQSNWFPQDKHYLPASLWTDHFLIHDDNFGPYYCMPVDSLRRMTLPKYDRSFRAFYAAAMNSCGAEVENPIPSALAESAASHFVNALLESDFLPKRFWVKRLKRINKSWAQAYVSRTVLLSNKEYHYHLLEPFKSPDMGFTPEEIEPLLEILPKWFYLVEITIPDLYTSEKTKILDILLPCSYPEGEDLSLAWLLDKILLVRYPGGYLKLDPEKNKCMKLEMTYRHNFPMCRVNPDHIPREW